MWNFEGNAKSRNNINLGGRVASVTKQDLLQKTREERRRREEDRLRNNCASKIQKALKSHSEKKQQVKRLRIEFDNLVSKHDPSQLKENFDHLFCKLIEFFDPKEDQERFRSLQCIAQEPYKESVFVFALVCNSSSVFRWSCLLSRFLQMILQTSDYCSASIDFLEVAVIYESYNLIENLALRDTTYQYILQRLVEKDIFANISKSMKSFEKLDKLLFILQQLLKPSVASIGTYHKYITQQWTQITLKKMLNRNIFLELFQKIPISELIQTARILVDKQFVIQTEEIHCLISNIIEIRLLESKKLTSSLMEDFFYTLKGLVVLLVLKSNPAIKDASEDEEEAIDLTDSDVDLKNVVPLEILGKALDLVNDSSDPILPSLVDCIIHVMIYWPGLKSEILSFLLHRERPLHYRGILPLLYDYVDASNLILLLSSPNQDWVDKLKSKRLEQDYNRWCQDWSVLYCLLLLTQRQLVLLGENSMIDDSGLKFLSLDRVQKLLELLSNCLFGLYEYAQKLCMQDSAGGVASFSLLQFRSSATALVRQIHDKNSRNPFLHNEIWLNTWSKLRQPGFASLASKELFTLHLRDQNDDEDEIDNDEASPRVAILKNIPFIVPFDIRVDIFSQVIAFEKLRYENLSPFNFSRAHPQPVSIRRASVFQDGFEQLNGQGPGLKGRISIALVNQLGMPEAGIDGGGVFKEFLNELIHQAFAPPAGLFLATADQGLYPNPRRQARVVPQIRYYGFLGRMVGKALFEGILIDTTFARFFLTKLLGRACYLDDLPSLDPELYQGLMVLQHYEGDVEKDFDLNFTITDRDGDVTYTVELGHDGEKRAVDAHTRFEYIRRVADYRLNTQLQRQSNAFMDGLSDLIPIQWLRLFDPTELQMVISGGVQPIDVSDLERHTTYSGVYGADHPTIEAFWVVVRQLDNTTLGLLVKFITSCARPPLQGFGALSPPLCIRDAGRDNERLPTASTCVNLLKLPNYSSPGILRDKLMYAIQSESGFELS